ncbi:hypothetical protein [Clostridioides sp. ZZV15-6597]|uniref:hypothetical protein n=1 Tax=Clostridioides sp. ZZV15-6597 TaxID=2811500 RepID=UPI001D10FF2F|nr:hypothetical protein [Clostridioides sp. ZZV15-6597]HBF1820565.1 hypothetical protein [Clostridioides difficile]
MVNTYIDNFLKIDNYLRKNGFFLDENKIKNFDILDEYNSIIDKTRVFQDDIYDITEAKSILRKFLGEEYLLFLNNNLTFELDYSIERLIIIRNIIENRNNLFDDALMPVIYYIASETIIEHLETIRSIHKSKSISKKNKSNYNKLPNLFSKYVLDFTIPTGYKGYYYEKKNLAHIAYLSSIKKGNPTECEFMIENLKEGLFFKDLDIDLEELYLDQILSGTFDDSLLDGKLSKSFKIRNKNFKDKIKNPHKSNYYEYYVKPIMMSFIGMISQSLEDDANYVNKKNSFMFYNINEYRIGVAIKNDISIQEVFPITHSLLKEVTKLNFKDIIKGWS